MLALFLWLHPPRQNARRSGYPLKSHFLFNLMGATAAIPCRFFINIKSVISKEPLRLRNLTYTTNIKRHGDLSRWSR